MGAGFSRINGLTIIQTSQGIAEYVLATSEESGTAGIVVGYDGRHNSRYFAELAAATFIAKGIKVWWYDDVVHTPLVPFAVKQLKAVAGIMITASHNPAQDNGYKVYASNGCQIKAPVDQIISSFISKNLEPQTWDVECLRTSNMVQNIRGPLTDLYIGNVWNFVKQESSSTLEHSFPAFVYTPLHGVGLHFMTEVSKTLSSTLSGPELDPIKMKIVDEQAYPDPEFPTVKFPNPEESGALDLAKATAEKHGISLIIANDPDADRLAVAEKVDGEGWIQYTGDQLGILLAQYILSCRLKAAKQGSSAYVLCSAVSSQMLSSIANDMGVSFEETLTGFKWLGNRARELEENGNACIFAYEEALGYMIPSVLFDKDGVLAAAVFLSACMHWGSPWIELQRLYQKFGYHVSMNTYWRSSDVTTVSRLFQKVRTFSTASVIASRDVLRWRDLTTGYDSATEDKKPALPSSSDSQMITCWLAGSELDDGLRFTIRVSGTEPKVKSTKYNRP